MSYGSYFEDTYSLPGSVDIYDYYQANRDTFKTSESNGKVFIKSAGNSFRSGLNCLDYVSNPSLSEALSCGGTEFDLRHQFSEIIVVASVNADGIKSSYSTPGSAIWVSGLGGEYGLDERYTESYPNQLGPAIMTTDTSGCSSGYSGSQGNSYNGFNGVDWSFQQALNPNCNYTSNFNGTSAAAPTVSGVVALMKEVNPSLTSRDIKHILAATSQQIDLNAYVANPSSGIQIDYAWQENAAGYKYHNYYGFGLVDAKAAIEAASSHQLLGEKLEKIGLFGNFSNPVLLENMSTLTYSHTEEALGLVEYVKIDMHIDAFMNELNDRSLINTIGIKVISPSGTEHLIMQPFTNIQGQPDYWWTIGVAGFYGEQLQGDWLVKVFDVADDSFAPIYWEGIGLRFQYREE